MAASNDQTITTLARRIEVNGYYLHFSWNWSTLASRKVRQRHRSPAAITDL